MFFYGINDNIIGISNTKLSVIAPFFQGQNAIDDYDEHQIYNLHDKTLVPDQTDILEIFKNQQFKLIKKKLDPNVIVSMGFTKIMNLAYLYQINTVRHSFKGSIDDMFESIESGLMGSDEDILKFKDLYPIAMKFKNEVIDKIEEFDNDFVKATNNYDLFQSILKINDLFVVMSDSYTFLKNKIYC